MTSTIKPTAADMHLTTTHFQEMLAVRNSTRLFRLETGQDIKDKVSYLNVGPNQIPGLIVQAFVIKLVVASYRGLWISFIGTVAVLGTFDLASLGVASLVAHWFAESRSLQALTTTAPATLFLALAISMATLVAEAFLLRGLIELPARRYPRVAAPSS